MKKTPRLFLLDGMALAYRSYYAFIQRPLINSRGENTSAIYGFVTFLQKILEEEKPDLIAVAFDTAAPTFRHKAYPEYKATREKMPEDMASQLHFLKDVVRAYNIPVLEVEGFEADDVIGTLAKHAETDEVEVYIVTPDKDFMQLVSPHIKIYKPGRQGDEVEIIDVNGVKEKFGVPPERVVDVLGLMGDKSDNIPGVPGIGEKTAVPLIQEFESIENLLKNSKSISKKGLREKLETHRSDALRSKKLVTIVTNVPVGIDFHELIRRRRTAKDVIQLERLFERLEFRSLLKKLRDEGETKEDEKHPKIEREPSDETIQDINTTKHQYTFIQSKESLDTLCDKLARAKRFVFDTETTSTDPLRAELVGISFSLKPYEAFFICVTSPISFEASSPEPGDLFETPRRNDIPKFDSTKALLPLETVIAKLKPILENEKIKKVGQNLKYDILVMKQYGIDVQGIEFDTMLASYLLRSENRHNLDTLAREHLGYKTITYDELIGTGKEKKDIRSVPVEELSDYACEDADITFRLFEVLQNQIAEMEMSKLFYEVELPLVSVLARMEASGVTIDTKNLEAMSKELDLSLDRLTREIYLHAGEEFNINSTQQLSDILFNKLKLTPVRKTKTGYSTDISVLEQLHNDHPIINSILDYRQLAKLKSTYVDALPQLINPKTGRVHTSYNQTVASTGRLSSSDPNLQNIPIRSEIGRSIRSAFIPSPPTAEMILSADYSQIELRIMAHISSDESLSEAFIAGEDIHATTASKVFGVPQKDVTRDMRRKAKEVNFGIMYGIGPFGLARRLDISQTEAKEIIDRYFERFPKVKEYIDSTIESARRDGFVSTLLGRRRYLPDIRSRNNNIRKNAERQAINMPIQGSAADMIKLAMVKIDHELQKKKLASTMILQVHDELVFELWKKEERDIVGIVRKNMEQAVKLSVPVVVDIGIGKNWLEAH